MIIYAVSFVIINLAVEAGGAGSLLGFAFIPLLWFTWAQGTKRCHDRGNSGWYQLIPFYGLWMLFGEGDYGINGYGENPKGIGNQEGTNGTPPYSISFLSENKEPR